VKIVTVHSEGIAADLGLRPGDELLEINNQTVRDNIDLRFHEPEPEVILKVAREGEVTVYEIEKEEGEPLGLEIEEMKVLSCGNDCVFCFVDQNPKGLRKELYFRDGDYRMSFLYGNYTTMTNAGPAILRRIINQRLSPQYISVHATDPDVRARLMGLRKDDRILEKIALLHDHRIDMHTQIVLCPGLNDGATLEKTVQDLYRFNRRIISLAVVPVGLTDHRFGLTPIAHIDRAYAERLIDTLAQWQARFRRDIGRGFVHASDEFYIVASREIPAERCYDGYPQIENGVGMVRQFLSQFQRQARRFPASLPSSRKVQLVTGDLAQGFMRDVVVPRLQRVRKLEVELVVAPNTLFGRTVTVTGLLSGKCVYSALEHTAGSDAVLLPPDILNTSGVFLDDMSPDDLERRLQRSVRVFDGRWGSVLRWLLSPKER
jgi:putative radical SAM enzyme (TIGR03279 family)